MIHQQSSITLQGSLLLFQPLPTSLNHSSQRWRWRHRRMLLGCMSSWFLKCWWRARWSGVKLSSKPSLVTFLVCLCLHAQCFFCILTGLVYLEKKWDHCMHWHWHPQTQFSFYLLNINLMFSLITKIKICLKIILKKTFLFGVRIKLYRSIQKSLDKIGPTQEQNSTCFMLNIECHIYMTVGRVLTPEECHEDSVPRVCIHKINHIWECNLFEQVLQSYDFAYCGAMTCPLVL